MRAAIKKLVPDPVRRMLRSRRDRLIAAGESWRERRARPDLYRLTDQERLGVVYMSRSDMRPEDRIMLYALVRGLKPERALEIGAFRGGSGRIIACAMEDNGHGRVVGIDPYPMFKIDRTFQGRYTLIDKGSPEAVPEARKAAGGPFDFILIDGIHTLDAVRADLDAAVSVAADGAYIFLHDTYNYGVNEAIQTALVSPPADRRLRDCGFLCRTLQHENPLTGYGGVRLLRLNPEAQDGLSHIRARYAAAGLPAPEFNPEILNHDDWFCRAVRPCERCLRLARLPAA